MGQTVNVHYALTTLDIIRDELGLIEDVPLEKAIKMAKCMLKGSYQMVKISKR